MTTGKALARAAAEAMILEETIAASSFKKPALFNDAEVLRRKLEVYSDEKDTGKAFLNV